MMYGINAAQDAMMESTFRFPTRLPTSSTSTAIEPESNDLQPRSTRTTPGTPTTRSKGLEGWLDAERVIAGNRMETIAARRTISKWSELCDAGLCGRADEEWPVVRSWMRQSRTMSNSVAINH